MCIYRMIRERAPRYYCDRPPLFATCLPCSTSARATSVAQFVGYKNSSNNHNEATVRYSSKPKRAEGLCRSVCAVLML